MATASPSVDVEQVLRQNTVREAGARQLFLAAIQECGRESEANTLERLEQLMRIEEHFEALLLYDQLEFLRQPAAIPEVERDFATSIQRICLEAANGFQRYLRTRAQWTVTREAMEQMYRATGLALHAIHGFVKWGCFLAEPGRLTPWKQLHALYSLAERDGYAQVPFTLHGAQPSFKPTVQALYLRTLILDMLNTGNLSKTQIEIADGWFAAWSGDYGLDAEHSTQRHLFYVDLESESGLHIMREDSHGASLRYVRADGLKMQLEEVQAGLRQGRLFAGHGAGAIFPLEEHVALLAIIEKLYQSVVAGSENRIEERTNFEDREVDAAMGMDLVMRKVREGPSLPGSRAATSSSSVPATAETFEISPTGLELVAAEGSASPDAPAEDPDLQRLRVFDLSSKGYGLLADRVTSEAILLNAILALRNQENGGWIIGQVVRKLPNRVRGEMLLGVEVLAYCPVRLELVCNASPIEALFLPGLDSSGRQDAILIRIADFSSEKVFTITAGGAAYRVRLNRIVKKGADWIEARFEIESKGQAA